MQKLTFLIAIFFINFAAAKKLPDLNFTTVDGQSKSINDFKANGILLVNIATRCGYTPQLAGLEELYKKYQKKGFVVLGVPSNEFNEQTPEKNKEVEKFCRLRYGATFPLAKKTIVKGKNKHPLFKELISSSSDKSEIAWNFEKFLIGKDGKLISRFKSSVKPTDKKVSESIDAILAKKTTKSPD